MVRPAKPPPLTLQKHMRLGVDVQAALTVLGRLPSLRRVHRADLTGSNLTGAKASLEGAKLTRASLEGAKLTRASLDRAKLTKAGLEGAKLTGVKLKRCGPDRRRPLRGEARLDEAKLTGAKLKG